MTQNHSPEMAFDYGGHIKGPPSFDIEFVQRAPKHRPGNSVKLHLDGGPVRREVFYCAAWLGLWWCLDHRELLS